VWFFDHSGAEGDEFGFHFGNEFLTGDTLQQFCVELGSYTQESTTLNFRHCWVAHGIEKNKSWLEAMAKWSGRTVTGTTGRVGYTGSENYGRPRPDYYYYESLYQVDPDGTVTLIFEPGPGKYDKIPY